MKISTSIKHAMIVGLSQIFAIFIGGEHRFHNKSHKGINPI
jgi:hypothetical protein